MKVTILTLCLLAFLFTFSTQTFAVDFTVNTTNDLPDTNAGDGNCLTTASDCSLRAAVQEANALATNDRVMFSLPANSTIILTPAICCGISITDNGTLEIIGTGANNLTIDGGGLSRIFFTADATVTISGITLTGGIGTGAAIYARGGSLTLDRVNITGNQAQIDHNGGGVYYDGGTHKISNSTFSANTAYQGGGIFNTRGILTILNSTISGNSANTNGGGAVPGNATLRNVTITNNSASFGGGISTFAGMLDFGNTIVAGNTATTGAGPEISTTNVVVSAGGNLVGDSPGDSTNVRNRITNGVPINYQPTDIRDVNPMLGILQNNGGTTPTHALFAGSPAIDFGLNALAVDPSNSNAALAFDQRGTGFPRIVDGNSDGTATVDIGAFEVQPMPTPTPTPSGQTCTPTTTVTEGDLFPGGLASFGVSSGAGSVTVDHVNAGTGLQSFTVVSSSNVVINIPAFTPGTFNPVAATFTVIDPNQPVDFTLRAASQFHAVFIRARCACTPTLSVMDDPSLFPGGIASFEAITSALGTLTVDSVNTGTGLQVFTVVNATNAVVNIPPFTPGTFLPVTATYTITNPSLPVDITLRATNQFHGVLIRLRCGTPMTNESEK